MPFLLSPVADFLSDSFGARWMAAGGFVANFVFIVLLRIITHRQTISHYRAVRVDDIDRYANFGTR